jgi:hypothetical protein
LDDQGNKEKRAQVVTHVARLAVQFDGESGETTIDACLLFLLHVWNTTLRGQGLDYSDYVGALGGRLGELGKAVLSAKQ